MGTGADVIHSNVYEKDVWRKYLSDYPFQNMRDGVPCILYQSRHAPELIKIAEQYHVSDHFSGESDLQNVLSLMNYVHSIACKSGDNASPGIKNTDEIMKAAKVGQLWCWDYATVLSEMLLSMGVKAVTVSCLPCTFDYDRHVGVMAYLCDMEKWVFLDPTFNTYFCGEVPMDIFEIRSSYSQGKTPAFRHIAIKKEWSLVLHGVEYDDYDSWYSDYMLKDTFRFAFPKNSAYGCASNSETVFLMPNGYNARNAYDDPISYYTYDPGCILLS